MGRARPYFLLLWVAALLWASGGAPTHADQAPNPFPSPSASAAPATIAPATVAPSPGAPAAGQISNPFPSPSPSVVPAAGNGYVAGGYAGGSATGGQIAPLPGGTSTPSAFPASGASGFWIDIHGRIAPSFLAALLYENLSLHGGDRPLVSYAQGRILYTPREARFAIGVGLVSAQRSTASANMNGLGLGFSFLPDFQGGFTPYGSVFVYPHLQTGGSSASLTSVDAGLMYVPKSKGGLFLRLGGALRAGAPANTSPQSVTTLQLGLGSAF